MAPPKKKLSELSRTGKYYRKNKKARDKKKKYDSEHQKAPGQVKKRVESKRAKRKAKKAGKKIGKHMDYDHAVGKFVSSKTNRGRRGEGNRKTGKRTTRKTRKK